MPDSPYWNAKDLRKRGFKLWPNDTGKPVPTWQWKLKLARKRRLDVLWDRRRRPTHPPFHFPVDR